MENQEQVSKTITKEEQVGITDAQKKLIYAHVTKLSKETINEISPALLNIALDSEKGALKNELGRSIFHLQKLERLNSLIGAQKLIDACIIVNPDEMFKVLDSSDQDGKDLAKNIKSVL